MGELFKKNWKRLTGVRGEDPLTPLEIVRLKDIAAASGAPAPTGVIALGGDLGGTSNAAVVEGLQSRPVASTAPASGQALAWDGSQWAPATISAGGGGTPSASGLGGEFRIDIPAGPDLATKIAGATLPAGWSIQLGNGGTVDAELAATVNDIVVTHNLGAFAVDLALAELDPNAPPLGGYYQINTSAVSPLSKSNTLGTQFSVLGFNGLITGTTRKQTVYVKLISTP